MSSDWDERTPPVTLAAVYAAVLRVEAQAERSAEIALASYEQSKRWAALERRVTIASFGAALFALAALLISLDVAAHVR